MTIRTDRRSGQIGEFAPRSMIVLTCVDGAVRATTAGPCVGVREALAAVAARGVSIVLTSHHTAAELLAIQRELGLREPFIPELGRGLYVPRGYFGKLGEQPPDQDGWEVFDVTPP